MLLHLERTEKDWLAGGVAGPVVCLAQECLPSRSLETQCVTPQSRFLRDGGSHPPCPQLHIQMLTVVLSYPGRIRKCLSWRLFLVLVEMDILVIWNVKWALHSDS